MKRTHRSGFSVIVGADPSDPIREKIWIRPRSVVLPRPLPQAPRGTREADSQTVKYPDPKSIPRWLEQSAFFFLGSLGSSLWVHCFNFFFCLLQEKKKWERRRNDTKYFFVMADASDVLAWQARHVRTTDDATECCARREPPKRDCRRRWKASPLRWLSSSCRAQAFFQDSCAASRSKAGLRPT